MKNITLIFWGVVLAALFIFMYYFMIEGFMTLEEARATGFIKANSDTICKAFGDGDTGDCTKCLDPDGTNHSGTECGYWPQGNACIPRSGIYRLVPEWLTNKQNTDKNYPQVFDPKDFVYNIGKCGGAACATFKSCKTCASATSCGWCDTNSTCMDRTAVSANIDAITKAGSLGSAGSPPQAMCPAKGSSGESAITSFLMVSDQSSKMALVQEVGLCRPEKCEDKAGCLDCTNTSGCGWCSTSKKCIKVDSAGNDASGSGGSSNPSNCPTGAIRLQSYMCPCNGITECKSCASQPGCGWCVAGKNCANIDRTGNVRETDCVGGISGVATSGAQCTPGAKLGNVRSERGDYKPSADQLGMTQSNEWVDTWPKVDVQGSRWGGGPGVLGSSPVSAATTTSQVTGNAVVRPVGAQGGPYSITNQPDLFTSPFEEYVKVLIKSELAATGIPTNEPFQDSSNIVNYLKKEVNKVVKKNF